MSENYIIDDDTIIRIDTKTKNFETDVLKNTTLIKGEHQSERLTFCMNRFVENKDLLECDKIRIHYINVGSSNNSSKGVYTVTDATQTSTDEIQFSWLISQNVTLYSGIVRFVIKFTNVDDDNKITYLWSTNINKDLSVSDGLDCDIVVDEEYLDILAQWEESITNNILNSIVTIASDVEYDNTNSGLESDNVQYAIDELSAENDALSDKLDAVSGIVFESWSDVQKIVRKGLAPSVFSIGDQFVTQDNYTGEEMVWDIIGFDCDTPVDSNYTHSMTIQLHDCYKFDFDTPEAVYCTDENGISAGQYYFTVNGMNYSFELKNSSSYAGYQLVFNPSTNATALFTYSGLNESLVVESISVKSGVANGTFLGVADGTHTNMNLYSYITHGSNEWYTSSVYLWLHSDNSDSYRWWIPSGVMPNRFSRPPKLNVGHGFLCKLDPDLRSVLGKVKKKTYNYVTKTRIETEDLMFLLSRSETCCDDSKEGNPYPYYKHVTFHTGSDYNRAKVYNDGSNACWALRSPTSSYSKVMCIENNGSMSNLYADYTFGIAPACCII